MAGSASSGWTPKSFIPDAPAGGAPAWRPKSFVPDESASGTEARAFGYLNTLPLVGGFGDELAGLLSKVGVSEGVKPSPEVAAERQAMTGQEGPADPSAYQLGREAYRRREKLVAAERPEEYRQGEIGGYATSLAIPGAATATLGRAALTGAALGAAERLGHSEADLTRGEYGQAAAETGLGAAEGALGGAAGYGIAKGIGAGVNKLTAPIARLATRRISAAGAKLDELAQKKVMEQLASAAGELGGEVQKGNRLVENLMRLESSMDPAEQALYRRLQRSGFLDELKRRLIGSNLEDLPGQAKLIQGKQAALTALQQGKQEIFDEARQALASPWAQIKPRLVRYLPPLAGMVGMGGAGALVGGVVGGDMTGAALGALGGAGARPAYHAIRRMVQHPAIQRPFWEFVLRASQPDLAVLGRFGPMLAMAAADGEGAFHALHLALSKNPDYLDAIGRALGLGSPSADAASPTQAD